MYIDYVFGMYICIYIYMFYVLNMTLCISDSLKKLLHMMPFQHITALQTNLLRWQILPICCKYRKTKNLPNSTRNDEDKYGGFMITANIDIVCNKCLSFKNNLSPKVMLWGKKQHDQIIKSSCFPNGSLVSTWSLEMCALQKTDTQLHRSVFVYP